MAAVVIASLPEARAALEAARSSGVAAELESPPDAATIYGVLWFAELNRALLAEFPGITYTLTLDCGDRADLAHAALVEGIKRIRFSGHPEAMRTLEDIAAQVGAIMFAGTATASLQPRAGGRRELLYVIAEPDIPASDLDRIQSARKRHDPQFDRIGPHFTFVFGTAAMTADELACHVRKVAHRFSPIAFELGRVEHFSEHADDHYLFLVPTTGYEALVDLHRRLNEGLLDTPESFVPHVTIARFSSAAAAKSHAEELSQEALRVSGRISALKVIAVLDGHTNNVAIASLNGG